MLDAAAASPAPDAYPGDAGKTAPFKAEFPKFIDKLKTLFAENGQLIWTLKHDEDEILGDEGPTFFSVVSVAARAIFKDEAAAIEDILTTWALDAWKKGLSTRVLFHSLTA